MDIGRRRLLVSLALSPVPAVLPSVTPQARAAEPDGIAAPIPARASIVVEEAGPRWRYAAIAGDGPVLRVAHDTRLLLRVENRLAVPTSLDLHGVRTSPPFGGAGPIGGAVAAGAAAELAFTPPDSGTFWFHPWILDPRLNATARGLAGVIVVGEADPPEVDYDVVALLTDETPNASDAETDRPPAGLRVGGALAPRLENLRPGSRVRLRVVNGSTRRALALRCGGVQPRVVAIDGQPSVLFTPRGDRVPLAPGARLDLMFDMPRAPGSDVTLAALGAPPDAEGETLWILKAEGEPRAARGAITALPPNPSLPAAIALETAARVSLLATATPGEPAPWSINGRRGVPLHRTPLFAVKRGRPVTLTFRNAGPRLVSFRVHGACLRVLHDLDDGWEPYWRESVLVPPGVTHHAAFVADRPGRWLIESPLFDQAAGGLRGWYEVS